MTQKCFYLFGLRQERISALFPLANEPVGDKKKQRSVLDHRRQRAFTL